MPHLPLADLPGELSSLSVSRPFLLCDPNTCRAAGQRCAAILQDAGIPAVLCVLPDSAPAPDEHTVGAALLRYDPRCDGIVGVGGGVINDTAKILAAAIGAPYLYIPTAPSMDGFVSPTSSMERDGLKLSLPSRAPDRILMDDTVLAAAPREMILAGYGDMIAKHVSLCEWRIAHIILDEAYCAEAAEMTARALRAVEDNIEAALAGDHAAVGTLADGLIIAGQAMAVAGVSRPASGMEHYISHIRDMRALAFGTPTDLHGIQCGAAAVDVIRIYKALAERTPDPARATAAVRAFSWEEHAAALREAVGPGASAMIDGEAREHKYDPAAHPARLCRIRDRWEEIRAEIAGMPDPDTLSAFMEKIGFPPSLAALGIGAAERKLLFTYAADIRDKYVLGRLLWDLGETELV